MTERLYPVMLKLAGRPAVVVGAGARVRADEHGFLWIDLPAREEADRD